MAVVAQARELLNSLKVDVRHMPLQRLANNTDPNGAFDQPVKDW